MIKLINTSSSYYGAGLSIQRKLMKIQSGKYAGRIIAVFPTSSSDIAFTYADPPYYNWMEPFEFLDDAADYPVGCFLDSDNHIHIAYTRQSSLNLVYTKLRFFNGYWLVTPKYVIYNQDSNYYPNLFKDFYGKLWVCWSRYSGGSYYINIKNSVNEGESWGISEDNPGTTLTSGASAAYSRFEYLPTYLFCFYTQNGTSLAYRKFEMSGAVWYSETEIYSGSGMLDNFATGVSNDLKLGTAFLSDGDLYYKDYDGASWSGNYSLDSGVSVAPALKFNGSVPFVFYGKEFGSALDQLFYVNKDGTSFTAPARVTSEISAFDKVLCYHGGGSVNYYDVTQAAVDTTSADIYHVETGKMLADSGDTLYLGQTDKFYHLNITLSSTGSSGTVTWYYWNGNNWNSFVPASGAYNFDSSPVLVRLWEDSAMVPADWQSSVINGQAFFWVKAVVISSFAQGPVGSQITAADNIPYISIL